MRKIFVTRGMQGAGKSTLLSNLGLDDYVVSLDRTRKFLTSPVMSSAGNMTVSQEVEEIVSSLTMKVIEERMARGEFIAYDATNTNISDLTSLLEIAKRNFYSFHCLDFSTFPFEKSVQQNQLRKETEIIPLKSLQRMRRNLDTAIIAEKSDPVVIKAIKDIDFIRYDPEDTFAMERQASKLMKPPVLDFSSYNKINHIGDIQGCFDVLKSKGSILSTLKDNEAYVFVGDFLDRGIQNGEVLKWVLEELVPRDNVYILWGNHEDHLLYWYRREKPKSAEFALGTLPQLYRAGIEREDMLPLINKMQDVLFYSYGDDIRVMVSHAGLSTVPENPVLISSKQYKKGTGSYDFPVDVQFNENVKEEGKKAFDGSPLSSWYQVHGHRNHGDIPVVYGNSINLEGGVEFGGLLKMAALEYSNGYKWIPIELKNRVYKPFRERDLKMDDHIIPKWMEDKNGSLPLVTEKEISDLRAEKKYIKEMKFGNISSFNFNKAAFYDKVWNNMTVKARGLFVNTNTNEVVSRGYPKFFNLGEIDDTEDEGITPTTLDSLEQSLKFPLHIYQKENGFFGTVGYDRETDEVILTSKSVVYQKTPPEGLNENDLLRWHESQSFPKMFADVFYSKFTPEKIEVLRREMRDKEFNLIFEINDPINDPHMIEYDEAHLVLLDAPRRSMEFELMDYENLQKLAKKFDVNVKVNGPSFKDFKSFKGWYLKISSESPFSPKAKKIEGYVVNDSSGHQFKIKLPYYSYWKYMRSIKDRILKIRGTDQELKRNVSDPDAKAFYDWAVDQPNEVLERDIISVRKDFLEYRNKKDLLQEETSEKTLKI